MKKSLNNYGFKRYKYHNSSVSYQNKDYGLGKLFGSSYNNEWTIVKFKESGDMDWTNCEVITRFKSFKEAKDHLLNILRRL